MDFAALKALRKTFKNFIACGRCTSDCAGNGLFCDVCCKWYHKKCPKDKKEREIISENGIYYCGRKCYTYNLDLPFGGGDKIDFVSAMLGDGLYPCKKCKRDCLDVTPCIQCSICKHWVHFECTKLSEIEYNSTPFYFCGNSCKKRAILPGQQVTNSENDSETVKENKNLENGQNSQNEFIKSPHFIDIKCSLLNPNDLDDSHFGNTSTDLVILHNNVASLNLHFSEVIGLFNNCNQLPNILAFSETKLHDNSDAPTLKDYKFEGDPTTKQCGCLYSETFKIHN